MLQPLIDREFQEQVREASDPVVVLFSGSWCQPCKNFKPVMENLASQMEGDIHFMEADVEQAQHISDELNIRSVPSLVLFTDGMVREIHQGTMSKAELRAWIQENV